nr:hypothetical protein Itr_chr03CG12250 [Ipomoea trifida]
MGYYQFERLWVVKNVDDKCKDKEWCCYFANEVL